VILPENSRPDLFPPPTPATLLTGKPVPVVLQALAEQKDISMNESAFYLPKGKNATVQLFVYNFGSTTAHGKLTVTLPEKWNAQPLPELDLAPGERKVIPLHLRHPEKLQDKDAKIRVTGQFGEVGTAVLAFRLTTLKD
jgi:uncharacterized membrane protein